MLDFNNTDNVTLTENLSDSEKLKYIEYNRLIIDRAMSGYYGAKRITTTGSNSPDSGYKFCAIVAVQDSQVSVPGDSNVLLEKNQALYGRFTSVSIIAGGYILAYQIPSGA